MTDTHIEHLKQWIADMSLLFELNEDPSPEHYGYFLQEPELALLLVDLIQAIDDSKVDDERAHYSACVFALDVCVAQLQAACENGNKLAIKTLDQLMHALAVAISQHKHALSFGCPF